MLKDHEKNKSEKNDLKTTGHEWDGIMEYNTPAPRWWLLVWIVCIVWAFGYWVFYPTWPTKDGNTKGSLNWTKYSQLAESQKVIEDRQSKYLKEFSVKTFDEIRKDPKLLEFALRGGKAAFKDNCAACHGTGAQGGKGFPNLNDDDWLWGGKIADIYQTLHYGIRSGHEKARFSQMPSFGLDKILNKEEIENVADYVLSLSHSFSQKEENNPKYAKGREVFKTQCASCHGVNGGGGREVGAPNLRDEIWLYGNKKEDVLNTITYAHAGVMPYWQGRLDEQTIRQLTLYVYYLGGGE